VYKGTVALIKLKQIETGEGTTFDAVTDGQAVTGSESAELIAGKDVTGHARHIATDSSGRVQVGVTNTSPIDVNITNEILASIDGGTAESPLFVESTNAHPVLVYPATGAVFDINGEFNVTATATNASVGEIGSALPASASEIGVSDGTNMQVPRAYDVEQLGGSTEYVLGTNLRFSAEGGSVEAGTSTNPLRTDPTGITTQPVSGSVSVSNLPSTQPVSATSLPLPTGAATETTLATLLTVSAFTARLNTLGQKTSANSTPVVLSSDQSSIPVAATIQGTPSVSVSNFPATQPVSASSLPLPTGAATSAKQPALGTAGTASSDVITIQGVESMTPLKVDGSDFTQIISGSVSVNNIQGPTLDAYSMSVVPSSDITGTATFSTSSATLNLPVSGHGVATVEITSSTGIAGTVSFTGAITDGYIGLEGRQIGGITAVIHGQVTYGGGSGGMYRFNVAGFSNFRVSGNIISGTAQVTVRLSRSMSAVAITEGQVQIAGSDGTSTHILKTLSDGTLVVDATGGGTQTVTGTVDVSNFPDTQPISATTLPLPTGAATETTLATLLTTSAFQARINTLGQKTMANSTPVVLASDQASIPVAATISGTPTVTVGNSSLAVTAASLPLPTGAATSAKQPALGTAGSASSDVLTIQGIASMTAIKVDGSAVTQPISGTVSVSNFPATQPVSGTVGVSGTVAVTDNSGSLTVDSAQLPTSLGAKTIANALAVSIASDQTVPVSGTVTITPSGTQTVSGTVTANIGTSGSLALDATLTGGTQKAINRGGAKGATTAADVTSTAEGANNQALDVQVWHGGAAVNPTQIRALTSSDTVTIVPSGTQTVSGTVAISGTPTVSVSNFPATQPVSAASLPLPTGASTAAKQPALGTAGTASTDVLTIQGIASMTAIKVDGSAVTQPVSGTVTITPSGTQTVSGTVAVSSVSGIVAVTDNSGSLTVDSSQLPTTLGSKTIANALAVSIASDQTIPISGSITATNASIGSNGSAIPTSSTEMGGSDGTNLQAIRVFDADTGVGTQYILGVGLRKSASGGSVEAGTSSDPLRIDPTGTTTQPISAASLPLPAGAATAAKQPTLGTAGSSSTDVLTVQGIASMTALKVDGSAVTQPVSGTITITPSGTQTVTGTVTANIGTSGSLALDATLTGGTQKAINRGGAKGTTTAADVTSTASGANHQPLDVILYDTAGNVMPSGDVAARAVFEKLTDGTNTATVKAANTAAVAATDTALVVAVSPINSVAITAAALPLPTGAATETTLGTRLADSTFTGRINTLGQKTMVNSTPVVLASDQSTIPISGTVTITPSGTQTVTGTVTANIGTSGSLALDATLTGNNQRTRLTDGTNLAAVKAASTAAVTTDPALVVAISPNNSITIVPSGTQTVSGTVAVSSVSGTVTTSLASTTITSSALPTGAATETTLGTRLADSTFTGRINTQGQKTMAASTPVVLASDQSAVPVSGTVTSNFQVVNTGSNVSAVAVTTASTTLFASNSSAKSRIIYNDAANNDLYVRVTGTAATSDFSFVVPPGGMYAWDPPIWTGVVAGIFSAGSGTVRCTEMT
jgi:trimeric autotransporter adhesin